MPEQNQLQNTSGTSVPLIQFQLDKASISAKSDYSWGLKLAQDIESTVYGGTSNYFFIRNARWKTNRNYANGKINMQKFMDLLEFNGKTNYVNISWQCIYIVNRIISGLVGRWMKNAEKISVQATDTLSTKQKQEEYDHLEFIIDNRKKLEQLQQESGVQILPQDKEIPQDRDELKLWQSQFQRLPEEILYELGINDILSANGWFDVLKEKMLHDSAETGFVGTYAWMDNEGVVHVEWLKPENCFYSYSSYPDFRDTSWRGVMRTMKISELRKKYSMEFNPNNPNAQTEEQIFKMAQTAKEYQRYDNITWNTEYNVTFLRPYDEWNVDVMEFELKTVDSEPYTVITTKKNKSTIIKKGKPNKPAENEKVIEDSKINIYRGVYARSTQTMLEWGLKKNMIRPQDPKEIGNAEFSYSFYMVQNYDMTCLGIPEKIQEAADQMIIARLRIQQEVAIARPSGSAVNWRAVQNIDYGLGDANKAIDFKKMFDQTGSFYYMDKDAEGNPIGIPFTEISNSGFLTKIDGYIKLYQYHYSVMKDELGEDPNLISAALQPRVTSDNVEASQQTAANATDYYYSAYVNCLNDTAKKVSCLLKDSVTYGAEVYRNIVGEEKIDNRIFSTRIQLLPDSVQIQKFEIMMQETIKANPDIVLFVNPFQLMQMAKEDVKLAYIMFDNGRKKMIQHQKEEIKQNQEATFNAQNQSAITSETEKRKTMEQEVNTKGAIEVAISKEKQKEALIVGFMGAMQKGIAIPQEWKAVEGELIQNVALPLFAENMSNAKVIEQGEQQAQEQDEQQQMQQQGLPQQPMQEPQPQQEAA